MILSIIHVGQIFQNGNLGLVLAAILGPGVQLYDKTIQDALGNCHLSRDNHLELLVCLPFRVLSPPFNISGSLLPLALKGHALTKGSLSKFFLFFYNQNIQTNYFWTDSLLGATAPVDSFTL